MVRLGQSVFDAVLMTDAVEQMAEGIAVFLPICKLDTVVGEHCMDLIGHYFNQATEELYRCGSLLAFVQLGVGKL